MKRTKSLLVLKKYYLVAALFWTIVITVLCLISFNDLPSSDIPETDKYVHFTFYFVFTVLWYLYLRNKNKTAGDLKILFWVLLIALFFGIGIELAQGAFTTTRQADINDVGANFTGALISVFIIIGYLKFTKNFR